MKAKITTKRLVILALLSCLSFGLHYIDSLIPSFLPIPGFRLGLANIITLFVLYYYGGPSYLFVTVIKALLVAILTSGFGITFMMSVGGIVLSTLISLLFYYLIKSSIYTLSIFSSLFHTIGQLFVYALFFKSFYIFYYIIILGFIAIATGALMALLVKIMVNRIPKTFLKEESRRRN